MDEKTELPVAATQVLVGNASSSSSSSLQDKERSISQNTEPTTSDPEKHADQPKKPSRSLFWTRKKKDKPEATEKPQEKQDPLAHLPDHERLILKRQIDVPPVSVTYKTLFRYASRTDIILMVISAICAIAGGAAMPLMTVVFGNLAGTFQGSFQGTIEPGQFSGQLAHYTLYFVYLGVGEFVTIFVATAGFLYTGEHIARKIRENYLAAILRQNIGYFDKLGAGEITTRITADTNLVQEGVSEKIGLTLTAVATFITAFVIGFIKSWKLTLILSCSIVGIVSVVGVGSKWMVKWNKMALESYARGGTLAEEVISSIRNATAFTTQDKLARQYATFLTTAEHWGVRHKKMLGLMMGVLMCIIYMTYALAFWQGSRFLVSGSSDVSLSDILTILLSIIIGAFSLGNVGPHVSSFVTATAAAGKIFSTIDRVSPLDPSTSLGKTLDTVEGNVELKHIKHIYPSRPEVVVMQDVNLFVPAGKTTALVGASGSGKSTIVGLVERFYDPVGGQVLLDGHDIKDLNLQFLRRQISLVSQEPTLFGTTIFKNIAHGLIGTRYEDVSDDEKEKLVMGAAELANAHGFIGGLPEGYETNVGERGFLLSGGQKQRIAIARAIVSDPKILLLDEATSALDTKSEGVVQAALDNAAKGRTTIIIAHRLSTIKTADNIVVMTEGTIVEQGTHNDLLEKQGAYYKLVEAQRIAATNTGNNPDEVELLEDNDPIQKMASRGSEKNVNPLLRTTTSKSVSSAVLTDRKTSESGVNKYSLWTLIKVVARFNKEEWHYMLVGLLASIIAGSGHPTQSIFFAKSIVALSYPPSQYDLLRSQINFWSWMYFMLALVMFVSYTSQGFAFAYCSERLIHRSRDRSFRTMLRQDIGFFDKEENTAGALTTFLSTETTRLAGLSGSTLGTILNVVTTLVASFILSLAIGWKLALVCIATVPILLGCGYFRFHLLAEFEDRSKKAYEKSASYACEATSAIRTVASLTRERDVWEQYRAQLVAQARASAVSVARSAALYAAAQSFMFLCIALGFWYGGTLIASGEYSLFQFFVCFSAVIFGAQSAGTIFSFAPDMGKAKHAAGQLKTLFDRQPGIDIWDESGEEIKNEAVKGRLEFRDVHFRYPTRPEQPVLKGLNLKVEPGQYVALVGQSGCGKSTTIGLLERFYDPLSGEITLDGHPITGLNIKNYRSHIALVSQEPTLYQGTIKDNVLLGADHPDGVGDDEIEQACADANILTFIRSLPDGFATVVGNKGVMLSGGQKQRVAIARALLRKPKVLLLDEATSALDSESEKVVQAALDHAAKGRTTVAVAHRLSTIQRADCIFVFESGVVVEKGTHNELMKRKGRYFELVGMQSLEKGV